MRKGQLYIIAAPSGAGKTSLVKALCLDVANLLVSVSHTTRQCRPGEQEEVNYFFVGQSEFEQMVKAQAFLEHANVFGQSYGTSKHWVQAQLDAGMDVILEIDWQGAEQVKQHAPDCLSIYIVPPSLMTLEQRLRDRAQDDAETIAKRMQAAKQELSHWSEFDYLVINEHFETALGELKSIILANRLRTPIRQASCQELLSKLV